MGFYNRFCPTLQSKGHINMKSLWLLLLGILYALWPYDLLPDVLVGWGWLDDLILLFFLGRFYLKYKKQTKNKTGDSQSHRDFFEKGEGGKFSEDDASDPGHRRGPSEKDPYMVLGLSQHASVAEIKQAYRELANKYHPDRVAHLGDEFKELAEERFKEIQNAYQTLMPRK
jgi:uncharacterized membrane protein YkvA (DUF1232 family)